MEKILSISLRLIFSKNTLGCYGLNLKTGQGSVHVTLAFSVALEKVLKNALTVNKVGWSRWDLFPQQKE